MSEEKPRGRGRPSNAERSEDLRGRIQQGLVGFAELLERRDRADDAESFAELIKRDADAMAEQLAALAAAYVGAEKVIRWLFGAGSVLGFAGAFGPLVSRLVAAIRDSGLLDFTAGDEPPPEPLPL